MLDDTLFTDDWYARQFAQAVERGDEWAVYYMKEIERVMKYHLNDTTLIRARLDSDG